MNTVTNRCKTCGGEIIIDPHSNMAECAHCGNVIDLNPNRARFMDLYSRGDDAWDRKDFDEALKFYRQIVEEDNKQAEAHWAIALCGYGIAYQIDPTTMKKMPTCNRINRTSILEDKNYLAAIAHASPAERERYQSRAQEIEAISKSFLKIVDKEPPRDVFISYKRTDADGRRTLDSQIAKKLYLFLKEKGFNVFFAEETLKEVAGEQYEPYIFAALTSAKVMVLFGSCKEHFEATWVKNEWRRFLALAAQDPHKTLIPAFIACDPYKALPQELLSVQSYDATGPVFCEEIADWVKKKVNRTAPQPENKSLLGRYATPDKVEKVISRLDCEEEFAKQALVLFQGDVAKSCDYIQNDKDYQKQVWTCSECGLANTHDQCRNPKCGISKKESVDIARRREAIQREQERKREAKLREEERKREARKNKPKKPINKKLIVAAIIILIVISSAISNVLNQKEYVDDLYTPEILTTYSGTYYDGEALITFTSCDPQGKLVGYFEFIVEESIYGKYNITGEILTKSTEGDLELIVRPGEWVIHPDGYDPLDELEIEIEENYTVLTSYQYSLDMTQGVNDKYQISTVDDLQKLSGSALPYVLANDLDLQGAEFTPIEGFTGAFRGNGHTISNLTIKASSSNVGFFGTLSGVVMDLNLENVDVQVTGQNENVGGICGTLNGAIQNCTVSGTINATSCTNVGGLVGYIYREADLSLSTLTNFATVNGKESVGGIVGRIWAGNTQIKALKNEGVITASGNYAGGLVGYSGAEKFHYDDHSFHLTDCSNTGDVTGKEYVGGLFGFVTATNGDSALSSSTCAAAIEGDAYVGCIAGSVNNINVDNCTNEGSSLTAKKYIVNDENQKLAYVGGIAGRGYAFSNCTNEVIIEYTAGGRYVGGIAGYSHTTADIAMTGLKNTADITGNDYVGGIFGYQYSGNVQISSFTNSGAITATGNYAGGLVGCANAAKFNYDDHTFNLSDCANTGNVTGKEYVGGLFGEVSASDGNSMLGSSSCVAVIEGDAYVGCIAGSIQNVAVDSCTNAGSTLTANKYIVNSDNVKVAYVGGIAGYGYAFSNCTNEVTIDYNAGGYYVGGIAGYSHTTANTTMTGLKNIADITGNDYVGGIFGYQYSGNVQIADFENSGSVTATGNYAGGLVGCAIAAKFNYDDHTFNLSDCTNTGSVTGKEYVGGLFGSVSASSNSSMISTSSCSAAIEGDAYVGCIAGHISNIKVDSCTNTGSTLQANKYVTVDSEKHAYVGGFAGYGYIFTNCTNEVSIDYNEGGSFVGGIAGYVHCTTEYSWTGLQNTADISGDDYVGGIFGYQYVGNTHISNFQNSGEITASGNYAGGLVGFANAAKFNYDGHYYNVSDCSNTGDVTGHRYVGGLFGQATATSDSSIVDSTNSGDISGSSKGELAGKLEKVTVQ